MKKILLLLALGFFGKNLRAQTTYNFNPTTATYTPITGTIDVGSAVDDAISTPANIGFNFKFGGCNPVTYSQVVLSSNGFMGLGSSGFSPYPGNNLTMTGQGPIIAPLWDDLATDVAGNVSHVTTGTSGSMVFTVEWKAMKWSGTGANGPCISFQVKLFESDNHIEFIYKQDVNPLVSPSASIGIVGGTATGDFYSLGSAITNPPYTRGVEANTIAAKPATGQVYSFMPAQTTIGLTPINVSCNGLSNGSLTAVGSGGVGTYTYSWSLGSTVSTITGLAPGTYTSFVTDGAGCQKSMVGSIFQPTPLSSHAGANTFVCQGGTAGLAGQTGSGGSSGYSYTWSPATGLSNQTILTPTTNVGATTIYTLTTIDVNGCSSIDTMKVVYYSPVVSGTVSSSQTICMGSSASSLNATPASGGNGAIYTYQWESSIDGTSFGSISGATSTSYSPGVLSGTKYFRIVSTNVCGVVNSNNVVVTVNPLPTANAGPDQVMCPGNFVTLGATATGGESYFWSPATGLSSTTASNPTLTLTTPGTYNYTVTATNTTTTCAASDLVVVTVNTPPTTPDAGVDQTVCNLTVVGLSGNTPTVGSGLWTITSGAGTLTNPTSPASAISGLIPGTVVNLQWKITNASCIIADNMSITIDAPASISIAGTDQVLCAATTTTISANTPVVGTGVWSVVSGTATISNPTSPTTTVTGLVVGSSATLRWTISNATCSPQIDDVVITSNALPDASFSYSQAFICNNSGLFSATITGTPGGSFSATAGLSINSVNGEIDPSLSAVGSYTVTYTTGGACSQSSTQLVSVYPPPTLSFSIGLNCSDNFTQFTNTSSVVSGAIVSYQWDYGDGNTSTFTNPSYKYTVAGNYTVTLVGITDQGCSDIITQNTTVLASPIVNAGTNQTVCQGSSTVLTAGGTQSYVWDHGLNNGVSFTPAISDSYIVSGTDANGCLSYDTVFVAVNPLDNSTFNYDATTYCLTGSNPVLIPPVVSGTFSSATVSGGSIDVDIATGAINLATSTAGTYDVTFTSNGVCSTVFNKQISLANGFDATFSLPTSVCSNGADINPAFTTGSVGVFSAAPIGIIFSNISTGQISASSSASGTYTITNTIPASGGCASASDSKTITINVAYAINNPVTICQGGTYVINGNTYTSTGTYSDTFISLSGCDSVVTTNLIVNPAITTSQTLTICSGQSVVVGSNTYSATGIYNNVLSTATGCDSIVTTNLTVNPAPVVSFVSSGSCQNIPVDFIDISTINGGSIVAYAWDFGDGTTSTLQNPTTIFNTPGIYTISLNATSNNSCTANYTKGIIINAVPLIQGTITYDSVGTVLPVLSGSITLYSVDNTKKIISSITQAVSAGAYSFNNYNPTGSYVLLSSPDSTTYYPNVVAQYHNKLTVWDSVIVINANCGDVVTQDIQHRYLVNNLGGLGTISGYVFKPFGRRPGEPVIGVDVSVDQVPGGMQAMRTTDTSGYYEFNNIPDGTYVLLVNIPGKEMDSTYTISINSATGDLLDTNKIFFADSTTIFISDSILVVTGFSTNKMITKVNESLSIIPNPTSSIATLKLSVIKDDEINISLLTATGLVVIETKESKVPEGNYNYILDKDKLNLFSGVYYLRINTKQIHQTLKLVIK